MVTLLAFCAWLLGAFHHLGVPIAGAVQGAPPARPAATMHMPSVVARSAELRRRSDELRQRLTEQQRLLESLRGYEQDVATLASRSDSRVRYPIRVISPTKDGRYESHVHDALDETPK